ncbi:MAG TPA: hypothetical protein VFN40_01095 [Gemmatimonadales bacterium]|nr:hypothetical protein [Gemmatimonadales bacterium]
MTGRESIGLADLELLTLRIAEGIVVPRAGCTLEISTYVWNRNSFDAQHRFEEACEAHGIPFTVKEQIGGIEWVCS